MNFEELYKEIYYKEEERKTSITNSLSLPVGIIGLLIGANFTMLSSINHKFDNLEQAFIFISILSLLSLSISIGFLIRASWGYYYKRLPYAGDMHNYYKSLASYYIQTGLSPDKAEKNASKEAHQHYCESAAASATQNAFNNDKKSANVHNSMTHIILSIIITSVAAVPYSIKKVTPHTEALNVEITNAKDFFR